MVPFHDKAGNPLGVVDWAKLREDTEYFRIGLDHIGEYTVSTVWVGVLHINFETMVFTKGATAPDESVWRYNTLADAYTGHAAVVQYATDKQPIVNQLRAIIAAAIAESLK